MSNHHSKIARWAPADAAELPSPLRSASPYAVMLAATPPMAAGGAITRQWAVALAAASVLAGAGAGVWSWMQRVMLCDLAKERPDPQPDTS